MWAKTSLPPRWLYAVPPLVMQAGGSYQSFSRLPHNSGDTDRKPIYSWSLVEAKVTSNPPNKKTEEGPTNFVKFKDAVAPPETTKTGGDILTGTWSNDNDGSVARWCSGGGTGRRRLVAESCTSSPSGGSGGGSGGGNDNGGNNGGSGGGGGKGGGKSCKMKRVCVKGKCQQRRVCTPSG